MVLFPHSCILTIHAKDILLYTYNYYLWIDIRCQKCFRYVYQLTNMTSAQMTINHISCLYYLNWSSKINEVGNQVKISWIWTDLSMNKYIETISNILNIETSIREYILTLIYNGVAPISQEYFQSTLKYWYFEKYFNTN